MVSALRGGLTTITNLSREHEPCRLTQGMSQNDECGVLHTSLSFLRLEYAGGRPLRPRSGCDLVLVENITAYNKCSGYEGLGVHAAMTTARVRILFAAALVVLVHCVPSELAAFPWSIDMYRGSAVQPETISPRVMPEDTLPTVGGEMPKSRIALIKVPDPILPSRQNLEHGRRLYATWCAPCHGTTGKGDGPVKFLLRVPPMDLTSETVRGMSDGTSSAPSAMAASRCLLTAMRSRSRSDGRL